MIAGVAHGVTASTKQVRRKAPMKGTREMQVLKHVRGMFMDDAESGPSWIMGFVVMCVTVLCLALGIVTPVTLPAIVPMALIFACCMGTVKHIKRGHEISDLQAQLTTQERTIETLAKRVHHAPIRNAREAVTPWRSASGTYEYTQAKGTHGLIRVDSMLENEEARVTELRIGHREREMVLTELGEHYAEGRITGDEFETRSNAAQECRTAGDLVKLLVDLPTPEDLR